MRSINEINKLFSSSYRWGSAAARLNFHLNGTGFAIVLYSLPRLPDCCSCSCIFIGIYVHSNKKSTNDKSILLELCLLCVS